MNGGPPFRSAFVYLMHLAWKSRLHIPFLLTVCFLVFDIRLQLEVNINMTRRRAHLQQARNGDGEIDLNNPRLAGHAILAGEESFDDDDETDDDIDEDYDDDDDSREHDFSDSDGDEGEMNSNLGIDEPGREYNLRHVL